MPAVLKRLSGLEKREGSRKKKVQVGPKLFSGRGGGVIGKFRREGREDARLWDVSKRKNSQERERRVERIAILPSAVATGDPNDATHRRSGSPRDQRGGKKGGKVALNAVSPGSTTE